jgi:hypothetical protein
MYVMHLITFHIVGLYIVRHKFQNKVIKNMEMRKASLFEVLHACSMIMGKETVVFSSIYNMLAFAFFMRNGWRMRDDDSETGGNFTKALFW